MDYFLDDYKYDRLQYAIGSNCTVVTDDKGRTLRTTLLPIYEQYRLKTNDDLAVEFLALEADCSATLLSIHKEVLKELARWRTDFESRKGGLTPKGIDQFQQEIRDFSDEIDRFKSGIDLINREYMAKQAFLLMNQTFRKSPKGYQSWRLFQIVFIVSLIPDIVACDPSLLTDSEKAATKLRSVDLLYFPTGGGKTEAFLGILVFNLFFDRLRGKKHGVTSMLKYPLRLLSVQQVQRIADVLAIAEGLRQTLPDQQDAAPYAVGYYVGEGNTPNRLSDDEIDKILRLSDEQRNAEYRVVDKCPFCGKLSVQVVYNQGLNRLLHVCNEKGCLSGGELPIMIVDTDIFRYLPAVIIATIDKMAAVGNQRRFKQILGSVRGRCPVHGYHGLGQCEESGCPHPQEEVELYDASPSLFIQDELHLVRESLGTYDAHYETFLHYFIEHLSVSKRPAKIIGATATISSYREQIQHLYLKDAIRFPCQSPYIDRNFYARVDDTDLHRLVLGYTPYGRAIINSVVYSLKYMRIAIYQYLKDPSLALRIPGIGITTIEEARKVVENYWIMLEYNNVKVDGNNVINALDDPINTDLAAMGTPRFDVRKMTGDDTFQDVRATLAEVENTKDVAHGFNMIVATSMISHGVDADRFNNIFFFGIPGNMAEYIQAYSRVGRKYTGIVVDIIRPTRERELSYQKNFIKSHEYKDILIDPVPINRWASKAIEQTLPGLFSALVLNYYTFELADKWEKIYLMQGLKQAVEKGWIKKAEVMEHLFRVYGCGATGREVGRGNQYRRIISELVDEIFELIDTNTFHTPIYITNGLNRRVMNSMRDTNQGLQIELR